MYTSDVTLHDFVLNLLTDEAARAAFVADPAAALSGAGLGDITAQDVQDVIPLVVDYAPALDLPSGGDTAIAQLQAVADAASGLEGVALPTASPLDVTGDFEATGDLVYGATDIAAGAEGLTAGLAGATDQAALTGDLTTAQTSGEGTLGVYTDQADVTGAAIAGVDRVAFGSVTESEQGVVTAAFDRNGDSTVTDVAAGTDQGEGRATVTTDGTDATTSFASYTDATNTEAALSAGQGGAVGTLGAGTDSFGLTTGAEAGTDGSVAAGYATEGALATTGAIATGSDSAAFGVANDDFTVAGDLDFDLEGIGGGLSVAGQEVSVSTSASSAGVAGGIDSPLGSVDLPSLPELPEVPGSGDPADLLDSDLLRGTDLTAGTVAGYVSDGGSLLADTVESGSAHLGEFLTGAGKQVADHVQSGADSVAGHIADAPAVPALPEVPAAELPAVPELPAAELPNIGDLPVDLPTDLPVDLPNALPELPVANPLPSIGTEPVTDLVDSTPLAGVTDHLPETGHVVPDLGLGH